MNQRCSAPEDQQAKCRKDQVIGEVCVFPAELNHESEAPALSDKSQPVDERNGHPLEPLFRDSQEETPTPQ